MRKNLRIIALSAIFCENKFSPLSANGLYISPETVFACSGCSASYIQNHKKKIALESYADEKPTFLKEVSYLKT